MITALCQDDTPVCCRCGDSPIAGAIGECVFCAKCLWEELDRAHLIPTGTGAYGVRN